MAETVTEFFGKRERTCQETEVNTLSMRYFLEDQISVEYE